MAIVKKAAAPVIFVLVGLAVAFVTLFYGLYTDAYAVYIDGEFWGYVEDTDNVEEQIDKVEREVSEIRNEEYTLDRDIRYEPVTVELKKITELDNVYDYLYDSVDDITENYILKVDDEIVGMGDYEELNDVVDEVKDQYTNENTVEVSILSDVEIEYETVPSETDDDPDSIENTLTKVSSGSVVYLTQDGDTLEDILDKNGLTETEFFALNPDLEKAVDEDGNEMVAMVQEDSAGEEADENEPPEDGEDAGVVTVTVNEDGEIEEAEEDLREGEVPEKETEDSEAETAESEDEETFTPMDKNIEIVISPEKSILVVETKDIEKHDEVVRYVREIRETDELYAGETKIDTEGVNGTVEVSETVISQNGTEIDRYESGREVTEEPVNEVILLGTKEMVSVKAYEEPVSKTASAGTGSSDSGTYYASGYMWPLQNYGMSSISSGYGWRYLNGTNEFHQGVDIAAAYGTPILASKAGTVITNTYNSGRGWYIQIDHGDGLVTLYQHMNSQSPLAVGTSVYQGQTVGYVGSTGYSFGNHLHFEVWTSNGTVIDPLSVFSGSAQVVTVNNTVSDEEIVEETVEEEEEEPAEETVSVRESIVAYAESFMDNPYVYGGHGLDMYRTSDLISYANNAYGISIPYSLSTPADVRSYAVRNYGISIPYVFDCSGFTGFLYRHFGYDMPYTVEGQIALGSYVEPDVDSMEPGDLIFFATTGTGQATHVGMYVGNGQYIHASSTYGRVMLDVVKSTSSRPIVAVRRILS